jgi:hypothetical protein
MYTCPGSWKLQAVLSLFVSMYMYRTWTGCCHGWTLCSALLCSSMSVPCRSSCFSPRHGSASTAPYKCIAAAWHRYAVASGMLQAREPVLVMFGICLQVMAE